MNAQEIIDTMNDDVVYTNQTAFDRVYAWLTRPEFSTSVGVKKNAGDCMYRGPCNNMCAVGVLIPNSQYRARLEHKGITAIFTKVPAIANVDMLLLTALQSVHDQSNGRESYSFVPELKRIAARYNLTDPEVQS